MEKAITNLGKEIIQDKRWESVIYSFKEKYHIETIQKLKNVLIFFAHQKERKQTKNDENWSYLMQEIFGLFQYYYDYKIIDFLIEYVPRHLSSFSYFKAIEFRAVEEGLLHDLEIPNEAWDHYWLFVDIHKEDFLSKMKGPVADFWSPNKKMMNDLILQGPGNLKPMSPFNWGVAVLTAIMGLLAFVDAAPSIMSMSPGIWAGSTLSSIIVSSALAGTSADKDSPLTKLQNQFVNREITEQDYLRKKEILQRK